MTHARKASLIAILSVLLLPFGAFDGVAQQRNVTFIHGLFGGSSSLSTIESEMEKDFDINTRRLGYSSDNTIPTIAGLEHGSVLTNSVVVAHSMGGLVSRSMVDQFGTSRVDALVTSGSPHVGVRAATTVQNGVAAALLNHWVNDLALGFVALGGYSQADAVAQAVLGDVFAFVDFYLAQRFSAPSVDDLQLGSSFMNNLNGSFNQSVPSATYAIAGLEDWNAHYRLAASMDDNREGNIMNLVNGAKYSYLITSFGFGFVASYNLYLYNQTGNWIYYDRYIYFSSVAQAFFVGFDSIHRQQQLEWDWNITGAWNGPGSPLWRSDGLVPYYSQVPQELRGSRELLAFHTNHMELKARSNAIDRVRDAFMKPDINVPEANQAPYASFSSSTSGFTAYFSNHSYDPDGSIASYSWSFGDGATSTQANPSHTYSTSGYYGVQLTVTDNEGVSSTSSRLVHIQDPGGGTCFREPCEILDPIAY